MMPFRPPPLPRYLPSRAPVGAESDFKMKILMAWAFCFQVTKNWFAQIKNLWRQAVQLGVRQSLLEIAIFIYNLRWFWICLSLVCNIVGWRAFTHTRFYTDRFGRTHTIWIIGTGIYCYYHMLTFFGMIYPHIGPLNESVVLFLQIVGPSFFSVIAVAVGKYFGDPGSFVSFSALALAIVCVVVIFDLDVQYGIVDAVMAVSLGTLANSHPDKQFLNGFIAGTVVSTNIIVGKVRAEMVLRRARERQGRRVNV